MTLDEWTALSPDERNTSRREWHSGGGQNAWGDLLSEACRRFKHIYGDHAHINAIDVSLYFDEDEPRIIVTTTLWPPQVIEELPDRFETFAVRQFGIQLRRHSYLAVWVDLLNILLDWSREQTLAWAEAQWGEWLNGKFGGIFYHDEPAKYVASCIVRELLPDMEGSDHLTLTRTVEDALRGDGPFSVSKPAGTMRSEINTALQAFGVSLPESTG